MQMMANCGKTISAATVLEAGGRVRRIYSIYHENW
jgi:hypothetical protein